MGTRMRSLAACIALTVLVAAVHAQDLSGLPAPLAAKVAAAPNACEDFNNGEFALKWGAVVRKDRDGDPRPDWVLDELGFACSSAVSLYYGTRGC